MKPTEKGMRVEVEVSRGSARLLEWLADKGIYGATPEIVAARLVDEGLQTFVKREKIELRALGDAPRRMILDEHDARVAVEALSALGGEDAGELTERIRCYIPSLAESCGTATEEDE